jgi:hypothetical protein
MLRSKANTLATNTFKASLATREGQTPNTKQSLRYK